MNCEVSVGKMDSIKETVKFPLPKDMKLGQPD